MKTFKFTLETLRTLRETREQQAFQDYSQALLTLEQATTRLESARAELEQAWIHFEKQLAANCPATELVRIQNSCQVVRRRIKECERNVLHARLKAHEPFLRLLAARQDSAVLDKCREKQKRRHEREQRKKEQQMLDELAGRRNALTALLQLNRDTIWN